MFCVGLSYIFNFVGVLLHVKPPCIPFLSNKTKTCLNNLGKGWFLSGVSPNAPVAKWGNTQHGNIHTNDQSNPVSFLLWGGTRNLHEWNVSFPEYYLSKLSNCLVSYVLCPILLSTGFRIVGINAYLWGKTSVQAALVGWEDSTTLIHGKYHRTFATFGYCFFHLGKLFPAAWLVLARTYSMGSGGWLKFFWNSFFPHDFARLKLSVHRKYSVASDDNRLPSAVPKRPLKYPAKRNHHLFK